MTIRDLGSPLADLLRQMAGGGATDRAGQPVILTCGAEARMLDEAAAVARQLLAEDRPMLGVGHGGLAVAQAFGTTIASAPRPLHSDVLAAQPASPDDPLLAGIAGPVTVGCYHRLAVRDLGDFMIPVLTGPAGLVLAWRHRRAYFAGAGSSRERLIK